MKLHIAPKLLKVTLKYMFICIFTLKNTSQIANVFCILKLIN
jgi:hypothetical protein